MGFANFSLTGFFVPFLIRNCQNRLFLSINAFFSSKATETFDRKGSRTFESFKSNGLTDWIAVSPGLQKQRRKRSREDHSDIGIVEQVS